MNARTEAVAELQHRLGHAFKDKSLLDRALTHASVGEGGMPHGKPAGTPCVQLDDDLRCRLFGRPERPAFCASLRPSEDMCGIDRADALARLSRLEALTLPDPPPRRSTPPL